MIRWKRNLPFLGRWAIWGPWRPSGLVLAAAAGGGFSLFHGLQVPINDDDVYHLHSIWQVAHGLVPYRDFLEFHLPGLWLLASPLAWLIQSPSGLVFLGRVGSALIAGLNIYLIGRIVRAEGWRALLLGVLGIGVLVKGELYHFRAEYVASLFVWLHFYLLAKSSENGKDRLFPLGAAIFISLACTMSVRPIVFLAVQPLFLWAMKKELRIWDQMQFWLLGVIIGSLPTLLFLSLHDLWAEAWFWTFRFASSNSILRWGKIEPLEVFSFLLGLGGVWVLWTAKGPTKGTRMVLAAAWLLSLAFTLVNPLKVRLSFVHHYFITAAVLVVLPEVLARRISSLARRGFWRPAFLALTTVTAAVIFFGFAGPVIYRYALFTAAAVMVSYGLARSIDCLSPERQWEIWGRICAALTVIIFGLLLFRNSGLKWDFNRDLQQRQLRLLDWLGEISRGDSVVLVAPHHPIGARNATDLQNAFQYSYWIESRSIKRRLANFSGRVLALRPAVISLDPWRNQNQGKNLLQWLRYHDVIEAPQEDRLKSLLDAEYLQIGFPGLESLPYGHLFWVRKDRWGKKPPPLPYTVRRPFSQ